MDLRRLQRGRALVLEQRGMLVQALAEHLPFHERLADAHIDGAFDLTFDEEGIESTTDVVSDPDFTKLDPAGVFIDRELDHAGRVGVARRWAHPAALELARPLGRRVRAG